MSEGLLPTFDEFAQEYAETVLRQAGIGPRVLTADSVYVVGQNQVIQLFAEDLFGEHIGRCWNDGVDYGPSKPENTYLLPGACSLCKLVVQRDLVPKD